MPISWSVISFQNSKSLIEASSVLIEVNKRYSVVVIKHGDDGLEKKFAVADEQDWDNLEVSGHNSCCIECYSEARRMKASVDEFRCKKCFGFHFAVPDVGVFDSFHEFGE